MTAAVEGMEVYLNEQRIGETKRGRAIIVGNLAAGRYALKARKPGCILGAAEQGAKEEAGDGGKGSAPRPRGLL